LSESESESEPGPRQPQPCRAAKPRRWPAVHVRRRAARVGGCAGSRALGV